MLGKSSKPVIEILTGSIVSGSPRTPADSKIQSPRGLKSLDLGGVGLGIVAALEKSGGGDGVTALFSRNFTRSSPIPVNSPENCRRREAEEIEMEVYSDSPFRIQNRKKSNRGIVFHISPASHAEATGVPAPDFLSSCDLCNKKLHGKDIYMYRGEKAFCSTECRYRQMVMDERKEKCGAEASAAAEVAGSPYNNGKMFAAGILAI